ncbi:hypothetical protein CVN56_31150 [Rhodococcus sp. AQ5-07]|nr:hypothetical protein CVN56_31150 [Rhodococcus sp. AQ5-07]
MIGNHLTYEFIQAFCLALRLLRFYHMSTDAELVGGRRSCNRSQVLSEQLIGELEDIELRTKVETVRVVRTTPSHQEFVTSLDLNNFW